MKDFLKNYLQWGEYAAIAKKTGVHPNTVYTWTSERNKPSVMILVWFFKAISEMKGIPYEQIWIDYIYYLEGKPNANQESKRWIQSCEHHNEEAIDEEDSSETVESD